MKKLLILLLFPLMMFSQDSTLIGDVDCSGEVNSQDASLILQFVTNVIDELPCEANMTGLTPEQLQEIINMMNEQLSVNYTGGGSNNYPAMISNISSESMFLGEAFIYCANLEEGGYSDWFLPNFDQLSYAISGGCDFPDERTDNYLWTRSKDTSIPFVLLITESTTTLPTLYSSYDNDYNCRCVRFGEGETSEGSSGLSNSSGSGSSILGNSEQLITMIGPKYDAAAGNSSNLPYFECLDFCATLNYNDYDDWRVPTAMEIQSWVMENSQPISIPNWDPNDYEVFHLRQTSNSFIFDGMSIYLYINGDINIGPFSFYDCDCFCVR